MRSVDIRQPQVAYQSLIFEFLEMEQRVEVAGIGVVPRVELEQIQTIALHAIQRTLHGGSYVVACRSTRLRHPLGEQLHRITTVQA